MIFSYFFKKANKIIVNSFDFKKEMDNKYRIKQSLKLLDDQYRGKNRTLNIVEDYSDKNISDKIIRIIISHIDYINTNTWHK